MCKEETVFNLTKNFGKDDYSKIFKVVLGQGSFGKVYSVLYYPQDNTSPYEIAVKQLNIRDGNIRTGESERMIEKEIAIMRQFSVLSDSKFVKFIDCFYVLDTVHPNFIDRVYLLQEKLDDNLKENIKTFQKLEKSDRYLHYLELIDDLRYFHYTLDPSLIQQYEYLEPKPYIHLDLKLNNIV